MLKFVREVIKYFIHFLTHNKNVVVADKIIEQETPKKQNTMEAPKLNLNSIVFHKFPVEQFMKEETQKKQIVIHHTVSGKGTDGDIGWWLSDPKRISTHFIIDWKGIIHQNYNTKYWGYHLGCNNAALDASSIAIEIDSWGGLMQDKNGLWRPVKKDDKTGKYVPNENIKSLPDENVCVFEKPFRGFFGFEKYTDAHIESLRQLLVYIHETYGIPIDYDEKIWDYNIDAMAGKPGTFSHTSYRKDKSDAYPYPKLINMLMNPYVVAA